MFKVEDSTGQEIFLQDTVKYSVLSGMGEPVHKVGNIICIVSETQVQIQPNDEGLPVLVTAECVSVTDSLIQDIGAVLSDEGFAEFKEKIEARYQAAVINKKKGKKPSAKRKVKETAPAPIPVIIDLGI